MCYKQPCLATKITNYHILVYFLAYIMIQSTQTIINYIYISLIINSPSNSYPLFLPT